MKKAKPAAGTGYIESVISDTTTNTSQSWIRERIVTFRQVAFPDGRLPRKSYDVRLRYKVESNAYRFQSSAVVSVWREAPGYGWEVVHRIPGENMQTNASYVDRNVSPDSFDADIDSLRRVASEIIF